MKLRSNVRDLASRIRRGAWEATLIPLLLLALSQGGSAQESPPGLKSPNPPEVLDVPYWGDKTAMEDLAKAPSGSLINVSTSQDGKNLIVLINSSCRPTYEVFRLENPPRLVVDFLKMENRTPRYNFTVEDSGVKQFRIAQFHQTEPMIARVVFDLDKNYGSHEIVADEQGVRIAFRPNPAVGPDSGKPATTVPTPIAAANPSAGMDKPKAAPATRITFPDKPPAKADAVKASDIPANSAKSAAQPNAPQPTPIQSAAPHSIDATDRPVTANVSKPTSAPALPAVAADLPKTSAANPSPDPVAALRKTTPVIEPEDVKPATTAGSAALTANAAKLPSVPARPGANQDKIAAIIPPASDTKATEVRQNGLSTAIAKPSVNLAAPAEKPAVQQSVPTATLPAANAAQEVYSGHPLTLDLVNFSLVDFFRLMAEEGGINVVVDPDVKGTASIKMTQTPWDQIFEVVLRNNGLEKQVDGNVVRIATKRTIQAEAKQAEDLKKAQLLAADVETRVRRLNYAQTKTLIAVLKDQMTVRGTVVEDERSGSLVITDVLGALDKITALIDRLDTPEPQVEIEARIVSANRDFARDIGIQFGFVQGNLQRVTVGGSNTFGTIGGTRPSATPATTYIAGNPDTGRGATQSSSTQSGAVSTGTSASSNAGNYNVNLPSKLPFGGLGLSVGNILDTFMLDAAITAGESKGQAKLISQPKLTTQNNSPGVITQGLRFPVQVIANNTVTVQFQNAALTLTVTPQITADGNIVLDLKIENNTPDFSRQVQGIPSIRTSESTTRVLVTDGGTTVIGGTLIDSEETQEDRVPGLASLPIFGNLFKRSSVNRSVQEVLFFITPRVVK